MRNILNAIKMMAENSDLKKVEKINTFCSVSSDLINTASIKQLKETLADAFTKATSLKHKATESENHPFFAQSSSNKKLPSDATNDPLMDNTKKRKSER